MGRQNKSRNKGKYKTVFIPNKPAITQTTTAIAATAFSTPHKPTAAATAANNNNNNTAESTTTTTPIPAIVNTVPRVSLSRTPNKTPNNNNTPKSINTTNSTAGTTPNKPITPRSVPLNGHSWKASIDSEPAKPAQSLSTVQSLRSTWNQRQSASIKSKDLVRRVRALQSDSINQQKATTDALKLKQEQKLINEKKGQIVQVISDSRKIKKMSRNQLKMIEKA